MTEEEATNEDTQNFTEDEIKVGLLKTKWRNFKDFFRENRKHRKMIPESSTSLATQLTDLRIAFGLLDRNQDGRVTATELQFMLQNLGIHIRDELVDDLMKEASTSGDSLIDEAEFLIWVAKIQEIRDEALQDQPKSQDIDDDLTQDLIAAFRVFDHDGNGFITRDELQRAMDMIGENVTDAQITELLTIADLDKDGKINYEEFAQLLL